MKMKILIFGIVFIVVTTIIANGLQLTGELGFQDIPGGAEIEYDNMIDYLSTYWQLVTFSIPGMPFLFSMVFIVLNLVVLWIIVTELIIPVLAISPLTLLVVAALSAVAALTAWIVDALGGIDNVGQWINDTTSEIGSWFDWGWW